MSAPKIKLSFGAKKSEPPPEETSQPLAPQKKLTLKLGGPKPSEEPAPAAVDATAAPKPKKKRASKPKTEAGSSKKRANDAGSGDDSDAVPATQAPTGPKRIKLVNKDVPKQSVVKSIRIKGQPRVAPRPLGSGYDSEASDLELDPHIEEDFILRMVPGEDCEYIRQAINERRLDRSHIGIKALTREGRRMIVRVRDKQYAATLVDLPCIIEGMKSWDKRMFYKSADITQMLLVLGPVQNEQEAMEYPLPKDVNMLDDKTYQYSHGLTPPMKYVRKRRFRKRVSARTIEQAEKEVANLIAQDEAAVRPPRFELVDATSLSRAEGVVNYDDEYDDEQDAYGEADYDMQDEEDAQGDLFEDELAGELEAALAAGADEAPDVAETPAAHATGESATPGLKPGDESSGDESEESDREADGDANGEEEDMDEEALERRREIQEQREFIAELEGLIAQETAKYEAQTNKILKQKIGKRVHQLKQDLALKRASIGESGGDDAA
ncbi:transcription initiation factor TFIID subunit 7, putative [Talaromyces stipitatus ATCC 10500]|uniref:Transcription initiation factor TFIID subunit 7, putative n=1 Tax=Talaromyces stipitatus (strain ATCC 10500 / CBS 375.48 / QM 6759 / NRRL 1006) TaxID=441959 RepID=B8MRS7_TALSN|nr:transcription initiation factor TFIID subunit 7, putative [Talaromyces stipitatus ATCC 10500]EED13261.1 transcription initiation factor TFIID subunit 7, putative [Talaromyces stipitatus ATCC 10500]